MKYGQQKTQKLELL